MQKPFKKSLQKQISLYFVLLAVIIINTIGWLFYFRSEHYFDEELGKKLEGIATSVATLVDADLLKYIQPGSEQGQFYTSIHHRLDTLANAFKVQRIYIINLSHYLLVDSDLSGIIGSAIPHLRSNLLELNTVANGQAAYSTLYRGYDGILYKSAFAPIINNQKVIVAIACVDASPVFLKAIDDIRDFLLIINLISFIISLILGYFLTRSITNPIKKLVIAAQSVSQGHYNQSINITSQNEIGFLGHTFNSMQENIHTKEEQLKALKQKAENEADAIKSYNELILQNIATGILTIDLDGHITVVNTQAARLLHIDRTRCIGKHYKEIFIKEHPFFHAISRLFKTTPVDGFMETEIRFDSNPIPVSVRLSPLPDSNGKTIGSNMLLVDLSEVRELQMKIKEKEWLAYLGELSAAIAHEIRNPLNSITLFLGLLKRHSTQRPEQLEPIEKITSEIDALNSIVSDFLNFARPTNLQKEKIELGDLFQKTLFLAEMEIRGKNINIEVQINPANLTLFCDVSQMKQALLNIVLNAAQAMSSGGHLKLIADKTALGRYRLEIRDDGDGISLEHLDKVFKPFFSTRSQGTGLGLAIVNNIINAHNGTIIVNNNSDKGVNFIIEIPLQDKN